MRPLLLPAIVALLAAAGTNAGAEVLRCVDAAGRVSYTDGNCPAGTRRERGVTTREPVQVLPDASGGSARPAPPPPRETQPAADTRPPPAPPQPQPSGAVIIDGRGTSATERTDDSRWDTERGGDPLVATDEGYGYPYPYAGVQRPPPRDMRPRIRNCDATGCTDTRGNTYNRNTGQLDRYQSIDGKTCRPVGSTTVCR